MQYRTHNISQITEALDGQRIKVAGWVENIRDHGGVMFIDLRDHYGVLQIVMNNEELLKGIGKEFCISVEGNLRKRTPDSYNPKIITGTVELVAESIEILGAVTERLPFDVQTAAETKEELRLKYRFLDLRNRELHDRIVLRSKVIAYMREVMRGLGFIEINTPILTASSPEGARDYLVPSRKHKGKFYALPQAPQIFKQLLMVSGFDKYFQIAPCFRDEDARADRAPGEFYQLDFEMAFATQEDVLKTAEEVLYKIFTKFSDAKVTEPPFVRIPYAEAMLKYGTDKPDLRNPLFIIDLTEFFSRCDFKPFKGNNIVRAIRVPGGAKLPYVPGRALGQIDIPASAGSLLGVEFSSGFGRNIFAPEPASAPVIFRSGDYVSGGTLVEPAKRAAVDLADGRGRDYLPFAGMSSECARELALSDKILEYGLRFPSGAK